MAEERVVRREQLVSDLTALRDRLIALPAGAEHRDTLLAANARMLGLAQQRLEAAGKELADQREPGPFDLR